MTVGSVARKDKLPTDIDAWVNVGGEERCARLASIVAEICLRLGVLFPGYWTFRFSRHPNIQVELICISNAEVRFLAACRQSAIKRSACLQLPVARTEHAGPSTNRLPPEASA